MTNSQTQTEKSRLRQRPFWRYWVGIILSLGCVIWLGVTTDWPATLAAIGSANGWLIATAVLLNLLTIPMRALRWQIIYPKPRPSLKSLTVAMLIGQAINVVAPARIGDLVRASLVEEKPTGFNLGTMVIQTALDLLMTAGLIVIILLQITLPAEWQNSGQALLITAASAVWVIGLIVVGRVWFIKLLTSLSQRWPQLAIKHLFTMGIELLQSFDVVQKPMVMLGALLWSLLIWLVYGLTNFVLLQALTPDATLLAAYLVLVVLQLSINIPSSPGRVGVYHILGQRALEISGQDSTVALTFAFILHLISLILPTLLGALLAWQRGININRKQSSL